MTKRIASGAAIAVQVAGVAAFVYGGFLLAGFVGWLLLGAGLAVVGMALEREVS